MSQVYWALRKLARHCHEPLWTPSQSLLEADMDLAQLQQLDEAGARCCPMKVAAALVEHQRRQPSLLPQDVQHALICAPFARVEDLQLAMQQVDERGLCVLRPLLLLLQQHLFRQQEAYPQVLQHAATIWAPIFFDSISQGPDSAGSNAKAVLLSAILISNALNVFRPSLTGTAIPTPLPAQAPASSLTSPAPSGSPSSHTTLMAAQLEHPSPPASPAFPNQPTHSSIGTLVSASIPALAVPAPDTAVEVHLGVQPICCSTKTQNVAFDHPITISDEVSCLPTSTSRLAQEPALPNQPQSIALSLKRKLDSPTHHKTLHACPPMSPPSQTPLSPHMLIRAVAAGSNSSPTAMDRAVAALSSNIPSLPNTPISPMPSGSPVRRSVCLQRSQTGAIVVPTCGSRTSSTLSGPQILLRARLLRAGMEGLLSEEGAVLVASGSEEDAWRYDSRWQQQCDTLVSQTITASLFCDSLGPTPRHSPTTSEAAPSTNSLPAAMVISPTQAAFQGSPLHAFASHSLAMTVCEVAAGGTCDPQPSTPCSVLSTAGLSGGLSLEMDLSTCLSRDGSGTSLVISPFDITPSHHISHSCTPPCTPTQAVPATEQGLLRLSPEQSHHLCRDTAAVLTGWPMPNQPARPGITAGHSQDATCVVVPQGCGVFADFSKYLVHKNRA